ncbi:CbbX protein [soil metagenome]
MNGATRGRGFGMPLPGRQPVVVADDVGPEDAEDAEDAEEQLLAPDATIDIVAARRDSDADEILARLEEELVGLVAVKQRVREIAALLLIERLRQRFGLRSQRPSLHMSFTGSPGTGKTTVALRMAELLGRLGYLRTGHLVTVTRDDLVGQYVGHSAPKTKEVLKRAMGGVLFIDEAYALHREDNERDYGQETIEILLQVMENARDDLVVILAGYAEPMGRFFDSNPGMGSRIAQHIDFPDYDIDELLAIGDLMLAEQDYELAPGCGPVFRAYLEHRMVQPRFANARSVRNALERARLRHASRLVHGTERLVDRADLRRLQPEDLLTSRVFTTSPSGELPLPTG